jgi:hypothetical protein
MARTKRFTVEKLLPIYRRAVPQPRKLDAILAELAARPESPDDQEVIERELARISNLNTEVTRG